MAKGKKTHRKSKAPILSTAAKILLFADGTWRGYKAVSANYVTARANIPNTGVREGVFILSGYDIANKSGSKNTGDQGLIVGVLEAVGGPVVVDEVRKLAPNAVKRVKIRGHSAL